MYNYTINYLEVSCQLEVPPFLFTNSSFPSHLGNYQLRSESRTWFLIPRPEVLSLTNPPSQTLSWAVNFYNSEFSLETNFLRLVQHQKSEGPETFVRIFNNVSTRPPEERWLMMKMMIRWESNDEKTTFGIFLFQFMSRLWAPWRY